MQTANERGTRLAAFLELGLFALLFGTGFGTGFGCSSVPPGLRETDKACIQGNRVACNALGTAYASGKDPRGQAIPLDNAKARQAFSSACERGLASACSSLGDLFLRGEGGPIDTQQTRNLYQRACELRESPTCQKLAEGYMQGTLGHKNPDLAFAYAKAGCEQKHKASCELWRKLGGKPPLPEEVVRLLVVMEHACQQKNDARACFALGEVFDQGKTGEVHKERAAVHYRLACDKGEPRGCHQLGIMMINAEGIPRAPGAGLQLLVKACEAKLQPSCDQLLKFLRIACQKPKPDADACTVLGRLYIKGERGVETDITKGVEALQRGCKGGDNDGCEDLRRLGL